MNKDKNAFAHEWIDSWNSHDIDLILAHYSDDVEVTTPMIKVVLGIDSGTLKGKEKVKEYWTAALKKVPGLKFELVDSAESVHSIAVYYKSSMNRMAIEVMFFNGEGFINKVVAHYR